MEQDGRKAVYGADGCRGGWICAALSRAGSGSRAVPTFERYDTFAECLAATADGFVVVDIPIGLLDIAVPGGRPCDRLARQALGWPRRNSVFSPPARPALHAGKYREAVRLNGSGMTQQAFRIIPKIREIDAAIAPRSQTRIFEGHPEMSFLRLTGGGVESPRTAAMTRTHPAVPSAGLRRPPPSPRSCCFCACMAPAAYSFRIQTNPWCGLLLPSSPA